MSRATILIVTKQRPRRPVVPVADAVPLSRWRRPLLAMRAGRLRLWHWMKGKLLWLKRPV